MLSVRRVLGRLVLVTAPVHLDQADVLRFQQAFGDTVRRLGDPPVVLVDLRQVGPLDASVGRMLTLMLAGGPLVRRLVVVPGEAGGFGAELARGLEAAADGTRFVARTAEEVRAALAPVATPAELHQALATLTARAAA
jgi:hypothetical protein